jgi:hypothetical protein
MAFINGKQITDTSITQSKLNLVDPTSGKEASTKDYVDSGLTSKISIVTGATGNLPEFNSDGELVDSGIEAIKEDFDLIDIISLTDIDADTTTVIPAKYRIVSFVFNETSGYTAGNISVGTGATGTEIINTEALGASALLDGSIGQEIFSITSSQMIYISSSAWGTSLVDITIRLEKYWE